MREAGWARAVAIGVLVTCGLAAFAQAPAQTPDSSGQPAATSSAQAPAPASDKGAPAATPDQASLPIVTGGRLHGVVKSGNIPLPGVTVTAQNTLTGKKYSTTTDITGSWSMTLPQNGRYVIRTQFAAFAPGSQEALLNAASHDSLVNFQLLLASRAAEQEQEQARAEAAQASPADAIRQLAGNGAESLSLVTSLSSDTETGSGTAGVSGAALPSVASNSDFSSDSVAISGQSGQVSAMAGVNLDQIRDAITAYQAANPGQALPSAGGLFGGPGGGGGFGGGGFGGDGGGFGGGGGGFGGRGGGGGRGNFRGFNPGQPHGAVFWFGSNSALNAEPFALQGQSQQQPASGSNRFGLTFMSSPYIPHLTKPSGKDTVFLTLSGTRQSSPEDLYAIVPTDAERAGDFSAAGLPLIYNPANFQQFIYNGTPNVIPPAQIAAAAAALIKFYPEPNLAGSTNSQYNYHLLTTAQQNQTQVGVRYNRSLGANATLPTGGRGGGGGAGRRSQNTNQGLRQSFNLNYNWSRSASDNVNIFPQLGGKSQSDSNSAQVGYTIGYHRITSIFNVNWNRSQSQATNFFTSGTDIATQLGILGPGGVALNSSPLNYGLPGISMSTISGLSQAQPNFSVSQTLSASEVLSWVKGKHNLRFGGDYRRVHRDFLGGSNATGSFTFTGLFTEDAAGDQTSGSPIADFLLGLPQSSSIDSSIAKSYLRDNVFDGYAQDDWRAKSSLTLNLGLRWEFFAPYTEKYDHLAFVSTNPDQGFTSETEISAGGAGLPGALVYPYRRAFAPRVGFAWRVPKFKEMTVRGSYGMNFTVGQYSGFATSMAHQPPFANEQTNEEANASGKGSSACAQSSTPTCFTLADGFPAPDKVGNYAVDPHYQLPYVQVWNLDVQKTLRWGIVVNLGYNGSKGSDLDIRTAPRATPSSPNTDPGNLIFTYEQAGAYSRFNAATVRVNKRMSGGVSLGANYQYGHSIDDAGSVGGGGSVVSQNWQDLGAEEGNSSFDIRHQVSGTYAYELPFGKDKRWITTGAASHFLEGFSISGTYKFATGSPLTPSYQAAVVDVARGTAGTLRPDRVPGTSITAGGGSLREWFNTAAYAAPAGLYGTAPRNSITGPGTVSNSMALSKTLQMGDTRSWEFRATASNVFNTVQYAGVNTSDGTPNFGQVTSAGQMRAFQFTTRFRF
jgi:hypothetical protein